MNSFGRDSPAMYLWLAALFAAVSPVDIGCIFFGDGFALFAVTETGSCAGTFVGTVSAIFPLFVVPSSAASSPFPMFSSEGNFFR